MNTEQKAKEMAIEFCAVTDVFKPNYASQTNAIKCCDQIIKELQSYSDLHSVIVIGDIETTVIRRIIYYQKVKREIKRL